MIGRTLDDRYAIVRQLGQGGMGAVYEARHVGTGRRVAVKIILDGSAQEEGHIARFHREARAVGAAESEHIAQVFDTGRDRELGAPYIAMEFLEGEDVQALLNRLGPLPVDLSLRIALQACLGLERAHAAGVIHRDIKPANLYLARKEQGQRIVKLLDFGIAKVNTGAPADHGLTKTGTMLGSPYYMSPEQARSGSIDPRSDLWSLGITLYQCISGRRPNEQAQGLGDLLISICSTPAPWLQTVAPWVPAEVAQVVHRTLSIDPAGRYASASELAGALRALLPYGYGIVDAMLVPLGATTRSYVAPQGTAFAASAQVPPTTLGTTGHDPRAAAATPRRPLGIIAGVAALSLLGAGGVYWQLHRGAPAPAAPETTAPSAAPSAVVVAAQPVTTALAPPPSETASTAQAPAASSARALVTTGSPVGAPVTTGSPVGGAPLPVKRPATPRPVASTKKVDSDDETSRK